MVLEKTLKSPLDTKEIKPISPKVNWPWIFIGKTDAEEDVMVDGIIDLMDMSLSKLVDNEGQGSLACSSPWGHKQLDTTEQLNNNQSLVISEQP